MSSKSRVPGLLKIVSLPLRLHRRDDIPRHLFGNRKLGKLDGFPRRGAWNEEGRRLHPVLRDNLLTRAHVDPFKIDRHFKHHLVREAGGWILGEFEETGVRDSALEQSVRGNFIRECIGRSALDLFRQRFKPVLLDPTNVGSIAKDCCGDALKLFGVEVRCCVSITRIRRARDQRSAEAEPHCEPTQISHAHGATPVVGAGVIGASSETAPSVSRSRNAPGSLKSTCSHGMPSKATRSDL